MVAVYVRLVQLGLKTIDQVPVTVREDVEDALGV